MKEVLREVVKIVYAILSGGAALVVILSIICELVGVAKYEKLLSILCISNGFEKTFIFSGIIVFLDRPNENKTYFYLSLNEQK